MPISCIVHFAQAHADFRLPELESIAELHGFTIAKPCQQSGQPSSYEEDTWNPNRPFWVVDLEGEEEAVLLARRCILVK